jgi:CRP/FNR family transcriptional regulator, anaerobic regulatory protein
MSVPEQKLRGLDSTAPEASSDRSCATCASFPLNLCAVLRRKLQAEDEGTSPTSIEAVAQKTPARRTIFYGQDRPELVPIICDGWAASYSALPGGRRQILSFLLPGDPISMACMFQPMSDRTVVAVTDVTFCSFRRSDVQALLFKHPDLFEIVIKSWVEEEERSAQLIVDLGRRTADERLSRLILRLADRLARRGMMDNQSIEFPLRQHHIADATGLTPVHVSKVLGEFQRKDLIRLNDRSLMIVDAVALRRISGS